MLREQLNKARLLVGHGVQKDVEVLKAIGAWSNEHVFVVDTLPIFKAQSPLIPAPVNHQLGTVLETLINGQLESTQNFVCRGLHNGANDAFYTMLLFLLLLDRTYGLSKDAFLLNFRGLLS